MSLMAFGKKRSLNVRDINEYQYQEKPLKLVKREYDSEDDSQDLSIRLKALDRHRLSAKQQVFHLIYENMFFVYF
jgi:hypothetical protein